MNNPQTNIETLVERIKDSEIISDANREKLLLFNRRMKLLDSEYSDHRREKLLRHCTRMAEEVGGLAAALNDREAAEDLVVWINETYDNENTKHDYRTALRVFGGRVTDGGIEEKPDSIEWIPSGTSNSYDPVPDPAEMLEWEADVLPMLEKTRNSRDAALIAVAFDSGARSGELQNLTVSDVSDHRYGLQLLVDGKPGQRPVPLIPSVPYLRRWLRDHPADDASNAPLWSKLHKPEEISYRQFRNIFQDAADRAGVSKPVTPTNFRKSNATFLARQGKTEAFINDRQGRKRGSDKTAHYVARFGGEADDEYARLHGLEVEADDPEPIGPVKCPRCEKETPRHKEECVWCRQALEYSAPETRREEQQEVRRAVLRLAQENPDLLEDFERARDLLAVFENQPDLHEDAGAFVEALSGE